MLFDWVSFISESYEEIESILRKCGKSVQKSIYGVRRNSYSEEKERELLLVDALLSKRDKQNKHMLYYGKCKICGTDVEIKIPFEILEKVEYFPFEYSFIHGEPPHGMLLYIDANWAIRGMELLKNVNLMSTIAQNVQTPKEEEKRFKIKKKIQISPMIMKLGIVTKREYEIISLIEKGKSLKEIAEQIKISMQELEVSVQKLLQKDIIEKL